jgi:catalase
MHWQLGLFILVMNPVTVYFTVLITKRTKELKKRENAALQDTNDHVMANMQRDGHMQMQVHPQRVTYTPSLLDPSGPRESPTQGFRSFPAAMMGTKQRERSATFSDHYSQARLFFESQSVPEQDHMVAALVFELSKVEADIVREAMLGHLVVIDADLGNRVAAGLGHSEPITAAIPAVAPRTDLAPAPSLSMLERGMPPLTGRQIGALVTDGAAAGAITSLLKAARGAGAKVKIICPTIGGVALDDGTRLKADHQLAGGPSVLFDAVATQTRGGRRFFRSEPRPRHQPRGGGIET